MGISLDVSRYYQNYVILNSRFLDDAGQKNSLMRGVSLAGGRLQGWSEVIRDRLAEKLYLGFFGRVLYLLGFKQFVDRQVQEIVSQYLGSSEYRRVVASLSRCRS